MKITADNRLKKLIVVGDRVLIMPSKQTDKTASGLYLPPGVQEKEKIQSGYVIKVGPGYPLPLRQMKMICGKAEKNKSSTCLCRHTKETWQFSFKKAPLRSCTRKKNTLLFRRHLS
jgi:co-chaperonin GroES (HSP10)